MGSNPSLSAKRPLEIQRNEGFRFYTHTWTHCDVAGSVASSTSRVGGALQRIWLPPKRGADRMSDRFRMSDSAPVYALLIILVATALAIGAGAAVVNWLL
jgi:hypothetical protein